jgi:hypothetical protein
MNRANARSWASNTIADGVPKFDIAREHRSECGPKAMMEKCAEDEAEGREYREYREYGDTQGIGDT